ncbi:hypothetical protein WJX82_009064 [Trebouxia sp. C0006]
MVQVIRCLVEFAKADLAAAIASFKTLSSILQPRGASGRKELEKQVQDINNHQASDITRTLLHESRDPEGEQGRSSKQAARAFHLLGIGAARICGCLSRQQLFPQAPYTEEARKGWAVWSTLRQQAVETFNQVWSRHGTSLSGLDEHIQEELLLVLLGAPAGSPPAGSRGLLSIMTAWTSACWDSGSAEKSGLQELSTEEKEVLAVDAVNAWCCFLDVLGAAFLTPGAAVEPAMTQVLCDVCIHSGSLVLLEAAATAWKKLTDTVMNAGPLSMRQELLLKPVIHMLKTCHTPDTYQASLGLW